MLGRASSPSTDDPEELDDELAELDELDVEEVLAELDEDDPAELDELDVEEVLAELDEAVELLALELLPPPPQAPSSQHNPSMTLAG